MNHHTWIPPEEGLLAADLFAIQSRLSEAEYRAIVEIRAFLDEEVRPFADARWERGECPQHLLRRGAELGIHGHGFPETRSFENSALFRCWIVLELARCDASTSVLFGVHNGLGMGAIAAAGSLQQRAEWLPRLARAESIAAFGLTEPEHGSDTARGMATTAKRAGDRWILNGAKRWIGNGAFADVVIVWARDVDDDTVKGFLVRTPTEGFSATVIKHKTAMRAVENAEIALDDVVVDESDRLACGEGFADVARILRRTRLEAGWQAVGVAMGAYEAALSYALRRKQFGRSIASFQLTQQKLADVAANISASLALCVAATDLYESGALSDHHASMSKSFAAARMRESVAVCRSITGGNGVQLDTGIARFVGDAEAIYTFEGTHEMNSLIVGRALTGVSAFV